MTTEIAVTEKHLAIFDVKEAILNEFKEAESLKCKDTESRRILGKFRAEAKSLRNKIEQARLDKNREVLDLNNGAATAIKDRLTASIDAYDAEIKPYDQIAKDKKEAKERAEAERVAKINEKMEELKDACSDPLEYNTSSADIESMISTIEAFEIDDSFQEMKPQAKTIKIGGIAAAKQALKARQEFEAQQAENERVRIENEAKAKELAEAQAKIEAEQERVTNVENWFNTQRDIIAEAQDFDLIEAYIEAHEKLKYAVIPEWIGDRDSEASDLLFNAMDKIWLRKCALEKAVEEEKELERKLAKAEAEAEKSRLAERIKWCESVGDVWYCADYDEAKELDEIFNYGLLRAKEIDEQIRIEKLAELEKRTALIRADRKALSDIGLKIDEFISSIDLPAIKTQEASEATRVFFAEMIAAISKFEKSLDEFI